jgi:hypothetical protein
VSGATVDRGGASEADTVTRRRAEPHGALVACRRRSSRSCSGYFATCTLAMELQARGSSRAARPAPGRPAVRPNATSAPSRVSRSVRVLKPKTPKWSIRGTEDDFRQLIDGYQGCQPARVASQAGRPRHLRARQHPAGLGRSIFIVPAECLVRVVGCPAVRSSTDIERPLPRKGLPLGLGYRRARLSGAAVGPLPSGVVLRPWSWRRAVQSSMRCFDGRRPCRRAASLRSSRACSPRRCSSV